MPERQPTTVHDTAQPRSPEVLDVQERALREQRWLAENEAAIDAWNRHVEAHGIPLGAYRSF